MIHENNESQHSAVKYLDKCFSSLQMSFMQYDYEPRFIEANVQNVPIFFLRCFDIYLSTRVQNFTEIS